MDFSIPLKVSSGGGSSTASYGTTVDAAYSVYSARLLQFNIPNAFTSGANTSQAQWWLGNIPARHPQNFSWNSQYVQSVVSGSGALSIDSITKDFTSDIKSIDAGSVKFAIYDNDINNKCLWLDDTNNGIASITWSANTTTAVPGDQFYKWYIATSGGNNFIISARSVGTINIDGYIISHPCDSNWNITSWTVNTFWPYLFWDASNGEKMRNVRILAVKDNFIWIAHGWVGWSPAAYARFSYAILSINSSWVVSFVSTLNVISWGNYNTGLVWNSYVKWNTAYCYLYSKVFWSGWNAVRAIAVDLTNTSTFTFSTFYSADSVPDAWVISSEIVWFDGTNMLIGSWTVRTISSGWVIVDTGLFNLPGLLRYNNTIAKMSNQELNFNINSANNNFIYRTNKFLWNTSSISSQILYVFKMSGTNEEDDLSAMKSIITNNATWMYDGLSVSINENVIGTDMIWSIWELNITSVIPQIAWTKSIDVAIGITNSNSRLLKAGFGLTGWTYISPTGANNLSGDATNGWIANAGGSYIDITL